MLRRLSNYLIDSLDDSTSSPGTLAIASSITSSSSNADAPPQMPIVGIDTRVHFQDFRPSQAADVPVGIVGHGTNSSSGGYNRLFGTYWRDQNRNPVIEVDSTSVDSLFTVTGASGTLIVAVTYSLPCPLDVTGLEVNGSTCYPLHKFSSTFVEQIFELPISGTTTVTSVTPAATTSALGSSWYWTFSFQPSTSSVANVFRHLNYHIPRY